MPEKPHATPDRKVTFIKPPEGIQYVYSNHVLLGQTVFDLRIVFGEVTDVTDEKAEITQRVQVTMSWLEAKALSEFLATFVKDYESRNGTIRTEFPSVTNPTLPEIPRILPPSK
jgi:hypothetical protein